ncbi:MAG: hypothetical protein IIB60_06210 [Planctomycetes bacterium]|nr:hypothetical protein [Planctomycetota bacterium]
MGLGSQAGCQSVGATTHNGLTIYVDGAGHWGDTCDGVRRGLEAAGYRGHVEEYVWTTSYNPLFDQWNVLAARLRARGLAARIRKYRRRHPDARLSIIAWSAGTGVATWAVELLDGTTRIDDLILLASSLSHDYDMTRAVANVSGKIYVYHSRHDTVLKSVRVIGTIDGKRGVDSAGLVGLPCPTQLKGRIVNIGWSRDWLRHGWAGAHFDCITARFVRTCIAKHVVPDAHRPAIRRSLAYLGDSEVVALAHTQ